MKNQALANIVTRETGVALDTLARPRKDKLVKTIGDLYDFKLNEITGKIELNGKPISGNFLRTFYLELAERNNLDIKETNAANVAILLSERNRYNPVEHYLNECNDWVILPLLTISFVSRIGSSGISPTLFPA